MENSSDVIREILLCLSSKSIFNCTCVSRRWNEIIVDPWFSKEYSKRTRTSLSCCYSGAFKMSYIFASSSSGPNSQRRHESPRKTRSGGQRVNRHVLARVRESAPRVRANLPLQVPPPPVVIVEDPEPVVVVEDLKTMLCPDDILGICLLTADQCQYAHGLDDQHISFFENVDEFGYPYKYNRCPKGKKIKLEECVQGLNCFGRHADEPSGSECRRFKRFRHCYLDANSCLFKH